MVTAPLLIVCLTALTLIVDYYSERGGKPRIGAACRISFFALAVWSGVPYFSHWPAKHTHEQVIHYLGSKYFRELGYTELYNAILIADEETAAKLGDVTWLMSLSQRKIEPRVTTTQSAAQLKAKFSPSRWAEFKSDCSYFIDEISLPEWVELFLDHGYNAPPFAAAWTGILTGLSPPSDRFLLRLAQIDKVIFCLGFACVWLSFGLRALLVSLIFVFTNPATYPGWIGGSILRYDWFFLAALGFLGIKLRKHWFSGAMFCAAACARVFPLGFAFSLALKWGVEFLTTKRLAKGAISFCIGFFACGALLTMWGGCYGGTGKLRDFYDNIRLYNETILTNSVGLRAVVIYRGEKSRDDLPVRTPGTLVRQSKTDQRYIEWRDKKAELWREALLLRIAVGAVFLLLFAYGARTFSELEQAALGAVLIYMFLAPNNYYFVFLAWLMASFLSRHADAKRLIWAVTLLSTNVPLFFVREITPLWITNYFAYSLALLTWTVLFYVVLIAKR